MNPQLNEILQKRAQLLSTIAQQRGQLAHTAQSWKKPLGWADQGIMGVRWLRNHPVVASGLVALLWWRKGRTSGLLLGAWRSWKMYRQFQSLLTKNHAKHKR